MSRKKDLIVVASTTRGRENLFKQLLDALSDLEELEVATLAFVFVQNDSEFTIATAAEHFSQQTGWSAKAVHEPELGIPQARNAAVETALGIGADWLAFIDDDETPRRDWIAQLFAGAKRQGADLCGGPVEQRRPADTLTASQEEVFRYFERTGVERARSKARAPERIDLATNNWLCASSVMREGGLRFDESMRFTGGSDTDFSRRAAAAGYKIGWVAEAVVSEVIPVSKLTTGYVFRRAESQTMAKYYLTFRKTGKSGLDRALFHGVTKSVAGVVRILLSPLLGGYTGLKGVRSTGVASGWLKAAFGSDSTLYETKVHR